MQAILSRCIDMNFFRNDSDDKIIYLDLYSYSFLITFRLMYLIIVFVMFHCDVSLMRLGAYADRTYVCN